MRTKRVVVSEYDPRWPAEFAKIAAPIAEALGDLAVAIEHVGSTSVPGLWAKPIIDIDIVIADMNVFSAVRTALEGIGYIHEGDLGVPGREAFKYDDKPLFTKHHLYVCPISSPELRRHITFRDHLRAHPDAAAEYGRVKREGAALHPEDTDSYIRHKSPWIERTYQFLGI